MGAEIWPLLLALLVVVALGIALLRSNRTLLAARKENLRLLGELDLHHQAFDLLQEGLLLIAPDSSLLYANPAAVALAGAGRAPVPGESLSLGDFLPPPLSSAVGYGDPEETTRRIVELGEGEEGRVLELTGGPDGRGGRVLLLRDLRGPAAVDRKRRDFVANALRKKSCVCGPMRPAARSKSRSNGASARATTASAGAGGKDSIRPRTTDAGARVSRIAVSRKAHFRLSASTRTTPSAPRIASTRPGKPAPLPRSTIRRAPGGRSGKSCAESSMWRRQRSSRLASETRLIRRRQRRRRAA